MLLHLFITLLNQNCNTLCNTTDGLIKAHLYNWRSLAFTNIQWVKWLLPWNKRIKQLITFVFFKRCSQYTLFLRPHTSILLTATILVTVWFVVVFGIISTCNAGMKIVIVLSCTISLPALLTLIIPNTTANHTITYTVMWRTLQRIFMIQQFQGSEVFNIVQWLHMLSLNKTVYHYVTIVTVDIVIQHALLPWILY